MKRILEPELMEDEEQVSAYARADFSEPDSRFIQSLQTLIDSKDFSGHALDLGCGPGNITCLFAETFPLASVDAVDGSAAMLDYAKKVMPPAFEDRIRFIHSTLQTVTLPRDSYDLIFSNSLLHHLSEPQVLWQLVKRHSFPGTQVAVMDLLRPDNIEQAKNFVDRYAACEPQVLQHDFYHSLLAAFSIGEIEYQLREAGLDFSVDQVSDRHVLIYGTVDSTG